MRFTFFCSFFCLFAHALSAQTITGVVYKAGTDSVITGASVYYGGSMAGTTTNANGRFQLTAKSENVPLTVSSIGYYSASVHYQPGQPLIVYLKPKQEELQDVVIRADGMDRKEEIALFTREFLGQSYYGRNCTIDNMDDISFFYSKKAQTLTATCDNPIIINNKLLGYTINYYLEKFIKTSKQTSFSGDYIFKENAFADEQEKAKVIRNREIVYEGSRMQLIRTLWNHTLSESDFSLYTADYMPLNENNILVRDSANNKYLHFGDRIRVVYKDNNRILNTMSSTERFSYIDSSGLYNAGLKWTGEMARQRVGDMLPFDYQPTNELKRVVKLTAPAPSVTKKEYKKGPVNKQQELFKSIVLVNDNPLSQSMVRKWDKPVYYKIYGTCGDKDLDQQLADFAKNIFKKVTDNSTLQITNTADDKTVNFFIILNGPAENYKQLLPADAVNYFAAHQQSPGYYSYNENGFTTMVKLVKMENVVSPINKFSIISYMLRLHILNGLGFFNPASPSPGSLFYNGVTVGEPNAKVKAADVNIIKALYRADIKAGMTGQEINDVLTRETP